MRKIIMAVDDDKHVLASLKRIFRGDKYSFVPFQSPVMALESLHEVKPHVIISDKRMPHMEGVDFLTRASEMMHCNLRILLTGLRNRERVNRDSIDRVFTKPWTHEQLELEIAQTHVLSRYLAIPVVSFTSFAECGLCGNPQAEWEIRSPESSEFLCDGCYKKMMPHLNTFQGAVVMNRMMGNVV